MQSEYFIFDGIKSTDKEDMLSVRIEGGFIETPLFGGQDIEEEWIGGDDSSADYGVSMSPIEFTLKIMPLDKEWTPQLRYEIGKWLIHKDYKSMQFTDDLGKIYYCKCVSAGNLYTMGNIGYLELTFRTNSPYAWSPIYIDSFDLSNNDGVEYIKLKNMSNIGKNYRPIMEIELIGNETNISIKNISNKGEMFVLSGLATNEVVSVDNKNEYMVSNRATSHPYTKFSGDWIELVYGENRLEVKGRCKIKTKMQFPIIQ